MRTLQLVVVAAQLALLAGCNSQWQSAELREFTPYGMMKEEATYGAYTVRTYQSLPEMRGSCEILKDGQRVLGWHGTFFQIGAVDLGMYRSHEFAQEDDVTGNGRPNIAISETVSSALIGPTPFRPKFVLPEVPRQGASTTAAPDSATT